VAEFDGAFVQAHDPNKQKKENIKCQEIQPPLSGTSKCSSLSSWGRLLRTPYFDAIIHRINSTFFFLVNRVAQKVDPLASHGNNMTSQPSQTSSVSCLLRPALADLLITNLRLLDLDKRADWPNISPRSFSTRDAQQNQKNRIKCTEWALYRLFELWDLDETRDVSNRCIESRPPKN
jgi:hypothetical protein